MGSESAQESASYPGSIAPERRIAEKERMLRSIFDAITESVLLIERTGVVQAINQTAAERLNCRVEEAVGRSIGEILDKVACADVSATRASHFDEAVRTGKPVRFCDKRGDVFYDHTYYPISDEDGHVTHVVVFAADVTARVQAEQNRQRQFMGQ